MPESAAELRSRAEAGRRAGRIDEARRLYEQAVAQMRSDGTDRHRLAHTIRHLGEVCLDIGDTDSAEAHCREAVSLYAASPDAPPLDHANAVRALALQREAAGDRVAAYQLWTDVRERYARLGIEEGVQGSTRHLDRLTNAV